MAGELGMNSGVPNGTVLQVAHVVSDLQAAISHWTRTLRAGPFFVARFCVENQHYRGHRITTDIMAAIGYLGSTMIEIIQPNDPQPSIFNEVLQHSGPGLHHYWLRCEDFDAELARYEAAGCARIGGGDIPDMGRAAYMDTRDQLGFFVELCEFSPKMDALFDRMKKAHLAWDGRDPARPYPDYRHAS
jgi:hypothetical protein